MRTSKPISTAPRGATVDFGNQFGDQIFTGILGTYSWEFDLTAATFPSHQCQRRGQWRELPELPGRAGLLHHD